MPSSFCASHAILVHALFHRATAAPPSARRHRRRALARKPSRLPSQLRRAASRTSQHCLHLSCLAAATCWTGAQAQDQAAAQSPASTSAPAAARAASAALPAKTAPASASPVAPASSPAAPPAAPQAIGSRGTGPGNNNQYLLRFDEDYSYLRNPDAVAYPLPYKFIALDSTDDSWLTLVGGERLFFDHNNMNVVNTPASSTNEFEARTTLGADLHVGSHFRFYFEGIDGQYAGPAGIPGSTHTDLGIYNAFAEIMERAGPVQYGVRLGRQELWLADGLVICNRDLANIPVSWNGARAYADWGSGRIDVFDLIPTTYSANPLQGKLNTGLHLYGIYSSFALPSGRLAGWPLTSSIEPFFIRYTSDWNGYEDAAMQTPSASPMLRFTPGTDVRNSYGVRYAGAFGPLDFDYTGVLQGGTTVDRQVHAWMFTTQTDYVWRALPHKPSLGMRFDGGSGGASGSSGNGSIATYQPLYYKATYTSDARAMSQSNTIDFAPRASIVFNHNTSLDVAWAFYYRQNQGDAIYNGAILSYGAGNPYRATAEIRGRFIGSMPDATLHWRQSRYQIMTFMLSYFMPGAALRKIGGASTYYVQVQSMMFF